MPRTRATTATPKKTARKKVSRKKASPKEDNGQKSKIDYGNLAQEMTWDQLRQHKHEFSEDLVPPEGDYVFQVKRAAFIQTKRGVQFKTTMRIRAIIDGERLIDEDADTEDLVNQTCANWHSLDNKEQIEALEGRTQAQLWVEWLDQLGLDVSDISDEDIEQIPTLLTEKSMNKDAQPIFECHVKTKPSSTDPDRIFASYRITKRYTQAERKEFEKAMAG